MQTVYAKSDYLEKENERIKANIQAVLNTCVTLNIYCAVEHQVWGIWIEVDKVKYLVNPIELVNSVFEDDNYWLLETYPSTENKYRTVDISKDSYCYSWRFASGVSKDRRPIYINFQEYVAKIKSCVEILYAAWLANKPTAYEKADFDQNTLGIAVEQMNISSVMPNYYRLMTSSVKEEPFVFQIEKDEYNEHYTIGIGNREYTTWLTHWDNDYDTIRYQFESYKHNREAEIKLAFDMSDLILKIKHVSVLHNINESGRGVGFKYKDYALVEIIPNEFVHGPILKGYCSEKQVVKTLYEGLLSLALEHSPESIDNDDPSQLEAYNMFKSPLIERYITGEKGSSSKAELRQVHVKRILKIIPDYDEVISDSVGGHIDIEGEEGNIDELYDKDGNPFMIEGLKEWQNEIEQVVIESSVGRVVTSFDWKSYHERGLALANQLRRKMSTDFDLWYQAPVEDKSGLIPKPVYIYEQSDEREE